MDDKQFIDNLLRAIDHAYWMLEVGDRVGALKVLSSYAKPRPLDQSHWLTNKKEKIE